MERGSRKRSSSARSEKVESVGDKYEKMEGYFSTGQSPQRVVVPMEEEENPQYKFQNLAEYCTLVKSRWLIGLGTCSVDGGSDWNYIKQLKLLMSFHTD
jgi:hypothetical protein